MEVLCSSFTPDKLNVSGQTVIQEWLHEFVIEVFAYLMRPKDYKKTFDSMLGEDRALERSVSFGACFTTQQNIMGNDAVDYIKALLVDSDLKRYDLLRSEPWDKELPKLEKPKRKLMDCKTGKGNPPKGLLNFEKITHRDIKVQGLIKIRLWDRTVWRGTGYSIYPDGTPGLDLLFEDEQAASAIFNDLKNELGHEDKSNRLRISIIRHIDKKLPASYRICISESVDMDSSKTFQVVTRKNTMTPSNTKSVEAFLTAYESAGRYVLGYAAMKDGQILPPTSNDRRTIIKRHINVIEAWEIGLNDMEMVAIEKDDDPIIPEGVVNPPVVELLKQRNDS